MNLNNTLTLTTRCPDCAQAFIVRTGDTLSCTRCDWSEWVSQSDVADVRLMHCVMIDRPGTPCEICGGKLGVRFEAVFDDSTRMILCAFCGSGVEKAQKVEDVRSIYGMEAAQLVLDGWTVDSAANHVQGDCDTQLCMHPSHNN